MAILLLLGSALYVCCQLSIASGLQLGFVTWLPLSVFSAGGGRGSFDAWYSTALDFEEDLSGLSVSHVHVFVADVVKSFDTVDRGILDFVLGQLGLLVWFRRVYFGYHANVRLRFKHACGLGSSWTRDGGIPQGCPLSMILLLLFIFLGVRLWTPAVGGPVVGKLRSDLGSGDGQAVHLFKDSSVSGVIVLRRRLGCVLSVLDGIYRNGLTLSRDLELSAQIGRLVVGFLV